MAITLDGTTGITTPGLTNTGTETIVNLTTTGNTILGDASTDTLNVGNGGLVKDASGNVGIGTTSPVSLGVGYTSITANNATNGGGFVLATGGTAKGAFFNASNNLYIDRNNAAGNLYFRNTANGSTDMTLDASGGLSVAGAVSVGGSVIRSPQYTATFPGAYATVVDLTSIGKGLIIYGYAMENAINTSTGMWLATGNGTTYTLTLVSQSVIGSGHGTIQLQMSNNGLQIRNALSSSIGNYKLSFVVLA
jgi:hypothetical protein